MIRAGPNASKTTSRYGLQVAGLPALPIGLGHHARDLAGHVGISGQSPRCLLAHGSMVPVLDERLGDVVQYEGLIREALPPPRRPRAGAGERSECRRSVQSRPARRGPPRKSAPQHELVVGLVLDDVADAPKARERRRNAPVGSHSLGLHRSTQPTTPLMRQMLLGQVQQPLGFGQGLAGLDGYGAADAKRRGRVPPGRRAA